MHELRPSTNVRLRVSHTNDLKRFTLETLTLSKPPTPVPLLLPTAVNIEMDYWGQVVLCSLRSRWDKHFVKRLRVIIALFVSESDGVDGAAGCRDLIPRKIHARRFFYHKPARRDSYAGSRVYYDELLGQVSAVQSRLLASRKVVLDVVLSYYNALCFRLHRRE